MRFTTNFKSCPFIQFDVELQEWQQAGLRLPSIVQLHKLATLEKQLVERSFGHLSETDLQQVQATLQRLLQAIRLD
jgi:mRNA interferase MazF